MPTGELSTVSLLELSVKASLAVCLPAPCCCVLALVLQLPESGFALDQSVFVLKRPEELEPLLPPPLLSSSTLNRFVSNVARGLIFYMLCSVSFDSSTFPPHSCPLPINFLSTSCPLPDHRGTCQSKILVPTDSFHISAGCFCHLV